MSLLRETAVIRVHMHIYGSRPDLASCSHLDSARRDSITKHRSGAKWPLGSCISLNKSPFGEECVPLDADAVQYPGVWIKWLRAHQRLPSARWVMLVNSAIRCIVNFCYLSDYSSWVWWQRPPSCQALAPSREHFISRRDDSCSDWELKNILSVGSSRHDGGFPRLFPNFIHFVCAFKNRSHSVRTN